MVAGIASMGAEVPQGRCNCYQQRGHELLLILHNDERDSDQMMHMVLPKPFSTAYLTLVKSM